MPWREPTLPRAFSVPCRQGQGPTSGFQLMLLVSISLLPWSDGKGRFHIALLHPSTVTITQVMGGSLGISEGMSTGPGALGAGCGPSVALIHHSLLLSVGYLELLFFLAPRMTWTHCQALTSFALNPVSMSTVLSVSFSPQSESSSCFEHPWAAQRKH